MKRVLLLVSLFAASPLFAKGPQQSLDINDFHCGIDSYHSSLTIDPCFVQDALNVYFDKTAGVIKRGGYTTSFTTTTTSAFSGLWSFTDNSANIWMIARTSTTLMATTGIGQSLFNIKVATVSANDVVNCVTSLGTFYCVDPTQGVYNWNGTSTTYVSGSPKGSLIANFHGRVWVTGLAVPNGNFLYGSKYLDGTVWATGTNATDPVALQVNLSDNADVITTLFAGYNDILYVFRNYNTYGLVGFDLTNFQISQLNAEVGCIDQRGIQPIFGGLVFPSARGIEFFDGYTATKISDPIKTLVDPITLGSTFAQTSWVQQTQGDWEAGTLFNLNATVATPALVLSTASFTDTVSADFTQGTASSITIQTSNIILSTNAVEVNENSFESGFPTTNWYGNGNWYSQTGSSVMVNCTITVKDGSKMMGVGRGFSGWTFTADVVNALTATNYGTTSFTVNANACTQVQRTISVSASSLGMPVVIKFTGVTNVMTSSTFTANSRNVTFWSASDDSNGLGNELFIDLVEGTPKSSISSGTFTSRTFDTIITSNTSTWSANWTVNTSTPYVELQMSTASAGPWSKVTSSTGTTQATNRYLRYISSFTIVSTQTALSTLNDVTVSATASSGTLKSQIHNIGTINSWGNFTTVNTANGGDIAFSICSSTNSNMGVPVNCAAQTANSQISIATGTYVQYYATFTVTAATQTPTLNSTTINWYSGTRRPPMASMAYDNRYWLSVTTNTADSTNDATFILSKGPVWSLFSIHAGAFTIWKNQPYFADADASGKVYQLEQGLNDNGVAINAFVKSKDFAPGGLIVDKFWDSIYLIADNAGAYNIDSIYYVDRSTVAFSLGTMVQNETPGTLINRLNIPIDSTHQNFGKTISFRFSNSDIDAPFRFYGGAVLFRARVPL